MESPPRGAAAHVPLVPAVAAGDEVLPPPPPMEAGSDPRWKDLPPGWSTAASPLDGRIYYWDRSTGRTSWTHPLAAPAAPRTTGFRPWDALSTRTEYHDTPWNASRRPDNHQCSAVAALLLCFPLGVLALVHSHSVDRAWADGRYGDAVNHSRQASQYSCYGTFLGTVFWVWWFFADELRRIPEWFRFD